MPKILIVEDDDFFREAISDLLKKKKFEVHEAPNGKAAREIMMVLDFDLVLTDIQMPGLSGVELLEWSQKNKPTPFVVMTGFSMLLETQSAYDLGAKEFISKPFKNTDLLTAIDRVLGPKEQKGFEVQEVKVEYCKVSIDEFVARPHVDFDVFVKLSDSKYIKLAHKGEQISKERVTHYREKGVQYLYIHKEDFGTLVDFNLGLAELIKDRSDVSQQKKMNFMKYTGEVILEKAFVDGIDKQSMTEAQSFINLTINTLTESKEPFDLLNMLNNHADHIYAHSLGVAMYSVMIARKMGIESNQAYFKLSTAAIFHDIGKKEIDREILDKPRHLLTTAERRQIESHATRSQEILMAIRGVPEDVVQIVYEHHEDCAGQGYPQAKTKKDLHPMSRILQLANLFMELALKGPHHPGMPGANAMAYIERVYGDRVDKECMKALKLLFADSATGPKIGKAN